MQSQCYSCQCHRYSEVVAIYDFVVTVFQSVLHTYCPCHTVLVILSQSYCRSHTVLVILYQSYCPSHTVQVILSKSYCPSYTVLFILFKSYCPSPIIPVLLWCHIQCLIHSVEVLFLCSTLLFQCFHSLQTLLKSIKCGLVEL